MKKILLIASVFCGLLSIAQLPNGSQAPDFTVTDQFGASHTLSDYLNDGKTVILDFSTTWCGPCWGLHESHLLKDFYEKHGPNGTCSDDIMVIFIESDTTTNQDDLEGTTPNSYGNWLDGTPYPMCDLSPSEMGIVNDYNVNAFPTLYKICPNGTTQNFQYFEASSVYLEEITASCYSSSLDGKLSATFLDTCSVDAVPSIILKNQGSTPISSAKFKYSIDQGAEQLYTYNGSIMPGTEKQVYFPIENLSVGMHSIEFYLDSINNIDDTIAVNNCSSQQLLIQDNTQGTQAPYVQDFSQTGFPYNEFTVIDYDGLYPWKYSSVHDGCMVIENVANNNQGTYDELLLSNKDISALTTPLMKFDIAYAQYEAYADTLQVLVSDDCGVTWTNVFSEGGATLATTPSIQDIFVPTDEQWVTKYANLSQFSGATSLKIKFRNVCGWSNNLYLDNINIGNHDDLSVAEESDDQFLEVYPNPVNGNTVQIKTSSDLIGSQLKITNLLGAEVLAGHKIKSNITQLNVESLPKGIYFVNLVKEQKTLTYKIVN